MTATMNDGGTANPLLDQELTVMEAGQREGPYEEPPEVTAQWDRFARRMQKIGGPVDLEAEVTALQHPYQQKRRDPNTGQQIVTNPNGVLITFRLVVPGFDRLTFYRDGRYSLGVNSLLYQVICAGERRKLAPGEKYPPNKVISKRVILTIEQGQPRQKPGRGGYFWNISNIKAIAAAGFGDVEDDEPAPIPAPPPPPAPPAPTAGARNTASSTAPKTLAELEAAADEDYDDVPF